MRKLIADTPHPIVLPPVVPNAGVMAIYYDKLTKLITQMHRSIVYWLRATYRANPPRLAQDSPATDFIAAIRLLGRRWLGKFSTAAEQMGQWFAQTTANRNTQQLKDHLKQAGWTVEFRQTRNMQDVFQATAAAQVGLIRSIAQQHLQDVQGLVMRAVQEGYTLHNLMEELQTRYGVTKKRAAFIARDQAAKANATYTRVRQEELGITQAIWLHSHAGKVPRPDHVAFSKGQYGKGSNAGPIYNISDGVVLDEGRCWPGTLINCRCVSKSIIPGLDVHAAIPKDPQPYDAAFHRATRKKAA